MAVTSLWPIKYRLDKVINYVRNPEKTTEEYYSENAAMHVIDGVLEYAADDTKTERRAYVTCLNCGEKTAARDFIDKKSCGGRTTAGCVTTAINPSSPEKSTQRRPTPSG